jgi:SP family general alpha glucoside:H+ symporter-like MFS transporter
MAYGVGRRTLLLCGLTKLFVILISLGLVGSILESPKHQASLATGALMIAWAAFYQFSVGTVAISIVAE